MAVMRKRALRDTYPNTRTRYVNFGCTGAVELIRISRKQVCLIRVGCMQRRQSGLQRNRNRAIDFDSYKIDAFDSNRLH